jgi:hypothetical protein
MPPEHPKFAKLSVHIATRAQARAKTVEPSILAPQADKLGSNIAFHSVAVKSEGMQNSQSSQVGTASGKDVSRANPLRSDMRFEPLLSNAD